MLPGIWILSAKHQGLPSSVMLSLLGEDKEEEKNGTQPQLLESHPKGKCSRNSDWSALRIPKAAWMIGGFEHV